MGAGGAEQDGNVRRTDRSIQRTEAVGRESDASGVGPGRNSFVIFIMEHPANFATRFARLVRLIDERADVAAQKTALRSCLTASRNGRVVLGVRGDALVAGDVAVRRDDDTDLLVARITARGIATMVIEGGAAPGDILTVARWLAQVAGADAAPDVMLSGLQTVHVAPPEPSGAEPAPPVAEPEVLVEPEVTPTRRRSGLTLSPEARPTARRKSGTFSTTEPAAPRRKTGSVPVAGDRTGSRSGGFPSFEGGRRKSGTVAAIDFDPLPPTRATELLELLDRTGGSSEVQRIVDDLVAAAEGGARNGDLELLADASIGLFARQADSRAELARVCADGLRRLLTADSLRLLPRAAVQSRPRANGIQSVLIHAGEQGASAAIAHVMLAPTLADRRLSFELLLKLPAAVPVLTGMLASPKWHVARNAADLLGQLHASEAHAALSSALQHADERVRRAAAHALSKLGTQPAVQSLRTALIDPSARVRVQVAAGLGGRKGSKSSTTLTRALDEEGDVEVQLAILTALGRLGTPDAVNRLIKAAEPDGRLFKKKPVAFRVAAVHALGDVRTPAARAVLQSLANDKEREVREAVLRVAMQSQREPQSEQG